MIKKTDFRKKRECSDNDCINMFFQYKTTDKYCSAICASKHFKPIKKTPLNVSYEKRKEYANNLRSNVALNPNNKKAKKESKSAIFKKEFDKQRSKIKRRLIKEHGTLVCEKCKTKKTIQFSTHHIVFRSERPQHTELNNLKNLIHLCYDCHDKFHKEKKSRNYLISLRNLTKLFGNIWGYDTN